MQFEFDRVESELDIQRKIDEIISSKKNLNEKSFANNPPKRELYTGGNARKHEAEIQDLLASSRRKGGLE